jgi:Tol biopolymer transport system component
VNEFGAKVIIGTETETDLYNPFFSPDGKWIGYVSNGKLKKIAISGGAPEFLCDVTSFSGASWGTDDTIVYGAQMDGIKRISAEGGIPETLIEAQGKAFFHPRILPDGKSLLFTLETDEGYKIAVKSPKTAEYIILFLGDNAWYLPTMFSQARYRANHFMTLLGALRRP